MRILLVDDDETLMESLAERLIQQRYAVDIAIDGRSAQTYVDLFDYDLMVLDLMLPDGDGIEFCQLFRQDGYANPVMILTAKESTSQKVRALDAGADDYVVKPFDFDELCARIRALLRREHQGLPTVLAWGPLRLDPSACETTYKNQPVRLTPKEFSMMELFLRHPHRVYSLGAIIDDLWSFEDPPGEDAVRTHIKGLRRKLKAVGAPKDLIKTVYGLGYRLNEDTGWTTDWANEENPGQNRTAVLPVNVSCEDQLNQQSASAESKKQSLNTAPGNTSSKNKNKKKLGDEAKTNTNSDRIQTDASVVKTTVASSDKSAAPTDVRPDLPDTVAYQNSLSRQLTQARHRYLCSASEKISTLEEMAAALTHDALELPLYYQSRVCVHKLIGSLGSFGVTEGSQLAQQIESCLQTVALEPNLQASDTVVAQLVQWVKHLRQQVDQFTVQGAAETLSEANSPGIPLMLMLSEDAVLIQQLTAFATQVDLQTQVLANGCQASELLQSIAPDAMTRHVVLIDVRRQPDDALFNFIQQIKDDYALPVAIIYESLNLGDRLRLLKQGVDTMLQRNALPRQVVMAVAGVVKKRARLVRVAIAHPHPNVRDRLTTSLTSQQFQTTVFERASHLWQWLTADTTKLPTDIVILEGRSLTQAPEHEQASSGLELCQILSADAHFQNIPVVLLHSPSDPASSASLRTEAYKAGADDVIEVNVSIEELAMRLRNRLPRG